MSEVVGEIAALWRFPVKSMRGEQLDHVDVLPGGLLGDRAYALIDVQTGKVLSAKTPKIGPDLLNCCASFVDAPRSDAQIPPVRIALPDGTSIASDAPDTDATLSKLLGREVTLARVAPEDFTIDQYHPNIEGLDPEGHRDTVTESKLGSAFFAQAGLPSAVPSGSFFDLFPVSVLTTSMLTRLNELRPASRFDQRRFRMNFIVRTSEEGFVENGWLGRTLEIGETARVMVAIPDPRCVMTTLAQEELPKDGDILRTLAQQNKLDVAGAGLFPCAGVYATVSTAGVVHDGDAVRVT